MNDNFKKTPANDSEINLYCFLGEALLKPAKKQSLFGLFPLSEL